MGPITFSPSAFQQRKKRQQRDCFLTSDQEGTTERLFADQDLESTEKTAERLFPDEEVCEGNVNVLNYGLTIAAKGQDREVKRLTNMSEQVATGLLSGVVRVSGFFTSSIVNSKLGTKFFNLLPGEIVLVSLDGFRKVFDAVEVAGRNVMSTTSVVPTGLVTDRYGDEAAKVTNEGLDAAGHAIGTAWTVFKIRKALKSVIKPTTLAKAAAQANSSKLKAKYNKSP